MEDTLLGVNLWSMAPSDDPQVKFRGLKHRLDPKGERVWAAEHVDFGTSFAAEDHLRLSLESARPGYLYVIDRDIYADGTRGAPTLIFPTRSLRRGNNQVHPGVPVEIPDYRDDPQVFTVRPTRSNQVAIEIIMIVSPRPLDEIRTTEFDQPLPEERVAEWERMWGSQVQITEDRTLAGKLYTQAEQTAAEDATRPLRARDPVPLTLYYRPGPASQPMLAKSAIRIARINSSR